MLKVWGRKTSVNVQKVMWAVGELGLAHERVDVGGAFGKTDTPEYGALNPNRLIPTIEDDGMSLWESSAIVRYLATTYGRGTLGPTDPHQFAKADQWMDWMQTTLYGDLIGQCFGPLVRVTADKRDNAAIAAAAARTGEKLAVLDAHLAGKHFILGDHLTMADIAVGCVMYRYFDMPIVRPSRPNVEAWYQRLRARKAFQDHVMIDWKQLKIPGA
jgi:glutathione S-transferase